MAIRPCRIPQFVYLSVTSAQGGTSSSSAVCEITIGSNTTPDIVLVENRLTENYSSFWARFEISNLCRDFIEFQGYGGSGYNTAILVSAVIKIFDNQNGGGTQLNSGTTTFYAVDGYDSYSNNNIDAYTRGNNKVEYGSGIPAQMIMYVPVPENETHEIPYYASDGFKYREIQFNTSGEIIIGNQLTGFVRKYYIDRICTKDTAVNNGDYRPIAFINKFGAFEKMWFVQGKHKVDTSREEFPRTPNLSVAGKWSDRYGVPHMYKTFNTETRESFTLTTFPLPEGAYDTMQEIINSEQIWFGEWDYEWTIIDRSSQPSGTFKIYDPYSKTPTTITYPDLSRQPLFRSLREPVLLSGSLGLGFKKLYRYKPVNVKTSSIDKIQSNLQRGNIQYNIEFEYAFTPIPQF